MQQSRTLQAYRQALGRGDTRGGVRGLKIGVSMCRWGIKKQIKYGDRVWGMKKMEDRIRGGVLG